MPTNSKVTELQSQLDALLNTLDHALTELSEARASKSLPAIALAAGRVHHVTGNDVPRYYIGGSYRVSDPQGLTVHPEQLAHTVFRALPMNHNKYMGFRTTLNYRQERCSPENP